MKLSRHSADVAFADKILYVTCGMMNLPGPLYVPRAVIDQSPRGKTAEMREYTCFQLLRRIFPCPWADGRLYITAELILFGNNLEQAIWLSARNTQEYLDCLDNTKTHIQGILRAENDELTGRMPEFPITEPFLMHTSDHGEPQEEFA
ncbi:Cucumopine_C domain-containing protein [Caenorhabditis elegans]|nr:Cucumopine_C domain-containing protein [Caenorhabditis elegans]CCA65531.1 Cucumopine_C domain-containing protein [Caenorhabditis elegans]|eukprot:NP_001256761.1 Uncharacterized protein CELE_C06H5.8 [Caenorhabditis elegans]